MLEYFLRNRRGSITIMLTIILIAALSLNSTLMELAKYNSMKQLYKEMGENAAFSLLAHYDRDLYENFGFLAVEQGVGGEDFLKYLQMNLIGKDSGLSLNNADILANVTNASVTGIYSLSQREVYREQMMEFCAYRAPLSIVNNALDIKKTLETLIKKLEEAIPMLEMFEELSGKIEEYVNTVVSMYDYAKEAVVCAKACIAYSDQLDSYNASLSEIDELISDYESEKDTLEGEDAVARKEQFEADLKALRAVAAENAADLQKKIVELEEELEVYTEKMTDFQEKCSDIINANMQTILDVAKDKVNGMSNPAMRSNALEIIGLLEANSDEGLEFMGNIDGLMDWIFPSPENYVATANVKLNEQIDKLGRPVDELEELKIVKEASPLESGITQLDKQITTLIVSSVANASGLVEYIEEMSEKLEEAIHVIEVGIKALNLAFDNGTYDKSMTNELQPVVGSTQRRLTAVSNPYANDELTVKAKLAEAEEIGKMVGYPTALLQPDATQEISALEGALNKMMKTEEEFRTACGKLKEGNSAIRVLINLPKAAGALMKFIGSIIAFIGVLKELSVDGLMHMIYQKLYAVVYATEMFSNRVTDTGSETRLNGSSFFTKSDYADPSKCFVQADAEYIYLGNTNEETSQKMTFFNILILRLLGNVTAVLTDAELLEVISAVAAIPIAGWIAAAVLIVVKVLLEAWFDMIRMVYAKEKVEIVKLNGGYFSLAGNGVDELLDTVEKLAEQIGEDVDLSGLSPSGGGDAGDDDSGSFEKFAQDYADGLMRWGYKDHLFLLMLLITPRNNIYDRTATLIERQLYEKKAKGGADYDFNLNGMYTYIRVETQAEYKPLLPIPSIPGANDTGIPIKTMNYSGY